MYCTACGQSLVPGAQACPRCGRPVGSPAPVAFLYDRVHRHIQILSILWLVYSVWVLLHWFAIFPFLGALSARWGWHGDWWSTHLPWMIPFITIMLVLRAILSAATGLALMRRAPWARVLAIVAAVLTLLRPIAGTVLAIYTLWALAPVLSANEYDGMARRG
jgi:zinc-ribbon domain